MKYKYILLAGLLSVASMTVDAQKKVVILHTNDTHSRIEPLPKSDKEYPLTAGVVNRKAIIDSIRNTNENVLLFDAGDFVQGTPYFNLFKGKVETETMNLIQYDAGTIGNHEFDYGLDTMKVIFERLKYPIVNCNYDFSNTVLKGMVKPYIVLHKFGLKIGVIGLGPDPAGLIQQDKYAGMVFNPILESANRNAAILKKKYNCDLVVCLSHIGYRGKASQDGDAAVLDRDLAQQSEGIDIIIGGHSHTYMEQPVYEKNKKGEEVVIYQMGKNGSFIGKLDIELAKKN